MALNIPFTRSSFAADFKSKLSGVNVTLAYDNIESTLFKIGVELAQLIGQALYDKICTSTAATTVTDVPNVPTAAELNALAKDHLQYAMANFAMYHHTIFLIAKIGNDGITIKKGTDETTIYKYQQDQLENKLITDAWFWMNQLIKVLEANVERFTDWKNSAAQKSINEIPVKLDDFKKWLGISDEYFMLNTSWIVREVWNDCVLSRKKAPEKTDDIARAVCYETMARACIRLSYYCLPETIRLEINNEMDSKNKKDLSETYIREKVAITFQTKADAYWRALDLKLSTEAITETQGRASTQTYKPQGSCENDSFVY